GHHGYSGPSRRPQLISEMLRAGQDVVIQIAKEPLGKKGARITSHVALPGRFLVYMPTVHHTGVSRKIISAENRSRRRRLVRDAASDFHPNVYNPVKLYATSTPIFDAFGIQHGLDKALRPKVWLNSAGYIVINHTEALVAIDVNTGKFVGKGSTRLEDTIVKTNLEAVKEIVRQIRLRDLGGIIVVDFIDMEERRNREKVLGALQQALEQDKAPSKALSFNEFGLVCITRKRTKQALERVLCQPCPSCTGSGMVKSIPTLCYEIQNEARKMAT